MTTATRPAGPARRQSAARGPGLVGPLALVAVLFFVIGHGCHGDDVDHEPAVAPPAADARPGPTASDSPSAPPARGRE